MKPADQPSARRWGGPGYFDLPVVHAKDANGEDVMVTAWELTVDELAQVQRDGRIWLGIAGTVHPPIWLSAIDPFEAATND